MLDYVDRLVSCGVNLVDAFEICEDFLYDCDYQGLSDYVRDVEVEHRKARKNVERV